MLKGHLLVGPIDVDDDGLENTLGTTVDLRNHTGGRGREFNAGILLIFEELLTFNDAITYFDKHSRTHPHELFAECSNTGDGRAIVDYLLRSTQHGDVQSSFNCNHTHLHYR